MRKSFLKTCLGSSLRRLTAVLLLLLPLSVLAQEVKVSGTITDATTGDEIIGATVKVEGSTSGAISDVSGNYQVTARVGKNLEFSFVGYKTQVVKVTKAGVINVQLSDSLDGFDLTVNVLGGDGLCLDADGAVLKCRCLRCCK